MIIAMLIGIVWLMYFRNYELSRCRIALQYIMLVIYMRLRCMLFHSRALRRSHVVLTEGNFGECFHARRGEGETRVFAADTCCCGMSCHADL